MKAFGAFRLDTLDQCLWREDVRIALTPKVFAVLRHLVEHPGRLVTQDELLTAIWPETYVQPEILRKYILELRKVLGDDPKSPRYIETLPKRGYRFLAALEEAPLMPAPTGVPGPVGRDHDASRARGALTQGPARPAPPGTGDGRSGRRQEHSAGCVRAAADRPRRDAHRTRAVRGRVWRQGSLLSDPGSIRPIDSRARRRRDHPDSGFAGAHLADPVPVTTKGRTARSAPARNFGGYARTHGARNLRGLGVADGRGSPGAGSGRSALGGSVDAGPDLGAGAPPRTLQTAAARNVPAGGCHSAAESFEGVAPGPGDAQVVLRNCAGAPDRARRRRLSGRGVSRRAPRRAWRSWCTATPRGTRCS